MIEIIQHGTDNVIARHDAETLPLALQALVRDGIGLNGAHLVGRDLGNAQLNHALLNDAYLPGISFDSAQLVSAQLRRANLYGANLGNANLSGADLQAANLGSANLQGANLDGADLREADLEGADLRGADVRSVNVYGAKLGEFGTLVRSGILQIGPIGSRGDCLIAYYTTSGIVVHTGCFVGTLIKFRKAVRERHGANRYAKHYKAAIALITAKAPEELKP